MRYFEIVGGFRVPVSKVEADILDRVEKQDRVARSDLNPQERETARRMATRGVLRYDDEEQKKHFLANTDPSLTRF